MKIKTQLIISMVFFAVAIAVISASVISTNQQVERLSRQEELAKNIELKVGELSYLSNDYLLYHESPQIGRWESKYASFSADVSNLTAFSPEQQVLVINIKTNQQRLKDIITDIVSKIESEPSVQQNIVDPGFIQVSSSRIGVQTQGIVFDASRLAQMLRDEADRTKQQNDLLIFALVGAFVVFLLSDYLLIFRGVLRSISNLRAGTKVIGSGNLDYSISEKNGDEVGELAQAFNQMTVNLKTVTASKVDLEKEIVERMQAEEALRTSEEMLEAFFDASPNILTIEDEEFRYVKTDGQSPKYFGLDRQSIVGRSAKDLAPELNKTVGSMKKRVIETGEPILNVEIQGSLPNRPGEIAYWHASYFPVPLPEGRRGVGVIGIDITERKKAEEALRLAYARLQTFFDHRIGGIGIVIANARGDILQANDYYLNILVSRQDHNVVKYI